MEVMWELIPVVHTKHRASTKVDEQTGHNHCSSKLLLTYRKGIWFSIRRNDLSCFNPGKIYKVRNKTCVKDGPFFLERCTVNKSSTWSINPTPLFGLSCLHAALLHCPTSYKEWLCLPAPFSSRTASDELWKERCWAWPWQWKATIKEGLGFPLQLYFLAVICVGMNYSLE